MCYSLQPLHHLPVLCRLAQFLAFLISEEALLPVGLYLIWLRITIFSLGATLHIFRWSSIKATMTHHPIIQKDTVELLAEDAIEPSTGGAAFYSYLFVVPKCTGGYDPYLTLSSSITIYTYLLFKMPTVIQVWQLIPHGNYAFSIDINAVYFHIPIGKHHFHFLGFVWLHKHYQWKFLPFGLVMDHRVFTSLTKPILFLS